MSGNNHSEKEISLMVAICELYYYKKKTQEEIGEILNISRPKVSRLLTQAREKGIIEIRVKNPIAHNEDLKKELKDAFNLKEAVITPMAVDNQEVIVPRIASAAAEFISENLPSNSVLGLGRGRTVFEVFNSFPGKKSLNPTLIPLSGGLGQGDAGFPVNELLARAASVLDGKSHFLYAPALLQKSEIRESILTEPHSRRVIQLWDQMDWVVVGIGTIPPLREFEDPDFYRGLNAFVRETGKNPIADICLWYVLENGELPQTSRQNCLIAATPGQLEQAKMRLAVAGGLTKARSIYAVLQTGLINALITEEKTAEELIRLKEQKG